MKFAKQLEEYELAEYKGQYLPYRELKKILYEIKEQYGDRVFEVPDLESPTNGTRRWSIRKLSWYEGEGVDSFFASSPKQAGRSSGTLGGARNENDAGEIISPVAAWLRKLEREAFRVSACMKHGFAELETQFDNLMSMEGVSRRESDRYFEMRLIEALGQVCEALVRLREFAELNHAALYKILKKHDKTLGCTAGLEQHLPRVVQQTGFDKLDKFTVLESRIQEKLSQMSSVQGLDASSQVSRLAAGLGTGISGSQSRQERALCFFLGSACAVTLTIIVLILLPPLEQLVEVHHHSGKLMYTGKFNATYFFSSFVIYRGVLCISLCLWSMGFVARVCTNKGINHVFLLGIDPRSRVSDRFLFGLAATFHVFWIIMFGGYIVDYKWMVVDALPESHREGISPRVSFHYVLYPIALTIVVFSIPWIPSNTCHARFKIGILTCIGRTVLAPAFQVSLGDNIVADVITSLTRPLQDIPLSACYLLSHHPQLPSDVRKFSKYGDVCPAWVPYHLLPIIAALPLWFRMMQCGRRFYNTHATKHLWNCGKYVACLMVVAVGAFETDFWVIFASSSAAIVYCVIWDVAMDWGLGFPELALLAQQARENGERQNPNNTFDAELWTPPSWHGTSVECDASENEFDAQKKARKKAKKENKEKKEKSEHVAKKEKKAAKTADSDSGEENIVNSTAKRPAEFEVADELQGSMPPMWRQRSTSKESVSVGHGRAGVLERKRNFSPQMYWLAVIFNFLARCSWVFTLLPVTTLSLDAVQRSLLHTVIAALEILRRSVWVILRMEHEQVANASGYRALLWVPRKLDGDVSELHARRCSRSRQDVPDIVTEPLLQA